jgi:predicted  nucleic acid-binding Zn-ribbon protein
MTVIETLEHAIERFTSDRASTADNLKRVTDRRDNLKAEINGLDNSIEAHYAAIGRVFVNGFAK